MTDLTRHAPCSHCGAQAPTATLTASGTYCHRCYRVYLVPGTCVQCDKRHRREPGANSICHRCQRKNQLAQTNCLLCNRSVERPGKQMPEGIVCHRCYFKVRPEKPCASCGRMRRDTSCYTRLGITKPICRLCLEKKLPRCNCCRRKRNPGGYLNGKPYCPSCYRAGGYRPLHCRYCHQVGKVQQAGVCLRCAAARRTHRQVERLSAGLRHDWTKSWFLEYANALVEKGYNRAIPGFLRKDLAFFVLIDNLFLQPTEVDILCLAKHLGAEGLRRFTRASAFLVQRGRLSPVGAEEVQWELHRQRVQPCIERAPTRWIQKELQSFWDHLLRQRANYVERGHKRTRVPLAPKAVEGAVRAALSLLVIAHEQGVETRQGLAQRHMDQLAIRSARAAAANGAYLRYFKTRPGFQPISIPCAPVSDRLRNALTDKELGLLLKKLFKPVTQIDLRWSIVTLLCLLYCQQPHHVLKMPLSAIKHTPSGIQIKFAKTTIPIDVRVSALIDKWLSTKREQSSMEPAGASLLLFPGRNLGMPASTCALAEWLLQFGIGLRALFPTALVNAYRQGLLIPRIAVDSFGMSVYSANSYYRLLGMGGHKRLLWLLKDKGRDRAAP